MNFVVIALPRTGSTHLTAMLNQQNGFSCQGEIFHPKKIFLRWPKEDRAPETMANLVELRRKHPLEFLDRVFAQNYGASHIGFKIFSGQNDDILRHLIETPSIGKVVLLRSNFLAGYSSRLIRHRSRVGKDPPMGDAKVLFNSEKFLAYCERTSSFYQHLFQQLNHTRQQFYLMHYEQINDPWIFSAMMTFLGGNPAIGTMESTRQKQNPLNIVSRFANAGDVSEFLGDHGLLHWQLESVISLDPLSHVRQTQIAGSQNPKAAH